MLRQPAARHPGDPAFRGRVSDLPDLALEGGNRRGVDTDPDTTCADPLIGPAVATAPTGNQLRVDANQPFPFYGVIALTP